MGFILIEVPFMIGTFKISVFLIAYLKNTPLVGPYILVTSS